MDNWKKDMKLKVTILMAMLATLISAPAFAKKVTCPAAKLEKTMTTEERVYVKLQDQNWHVLGFVGDKDLDKKLKKIRKAERKGFYVQLKFPKGYDESCMVSDNDVAADKVKIKKKLKDFEGS